MDGQADAAREITQLLVAWRNGDTEAANRLFPLIYDELRRIARRELRRVGGGADTNSLVHQAYVRLVDRTRGEIHDRSHFFAMAAKAMRHILVDHARERTALKRGGGRPDTVLDEALAAVEARGVEIVAVDAVLEKLQAIEPRLVQLVELRFFGGLSVDEIAQTLGVSERTVRREWQKARALLAVELSLGSA